MLKLKKILDSIADIGQNLLGKKIFIKKESQDLIKLCDDLISFKGAAYGITIARNITINYQNLTNEEKLNFFKEINDRYKPNIDIVEKNAAKFIEKKDNKTLRTLFLSAEGKRRELFTRLNMAPNGTSILVLMREDILRNLPQHPELKELDDDLKNLFKSWFNPGFLKLEKITWETKALVLEKIIKYEKVHKIKDMNDLKKRLGENKRFFAYFHPVLQDEPIIFVQVAFTKGLGKSIQKIIKPLDELKNKFDTATFYSISNCQEGLTRVTLGNFLIKRVIYEIQDENPEIKNFGTLSPLTGFRDWFNELSGMHLKSILGESAASNLSFLKSPNLKIGDPRIVSEKNSLKKLVMHYLLKEKSDGKPHNLVSRFHLGNGASIDDVIINANVSDYGYERSFGIMVNYIYELNKVEKNHEEYINYNKINYSDKLRKYTNRLN